MRNRLGGVDEDVDEDDEEDDDTREASRSRASWFLYQRILSAEMRMKSFLGWSGPALWRLEGRGEVTRAIACVGWLVVVLVWEVLSVEEKSCPRWPPGEVLGSWAGLVWTGCCVYGGLLAGGPGSCRLNGSVICFSFCFARGIFRTCESSMVENDRIGFHPGTWSLW